MFAAHRGLRRIGPALLLALSAPAAAHEYWIQPLDPTVAPGETVRGKLLVGQMMQGTELPWLSHRIASFRVVTPGGVRDLAGTEGDLPALAYAAAEPGLHVIAHETHPLPVTFDMLAEFRDYLDYEGLGAVADDHLARGLPETDITESYRRAAKALVQVGPVREGDADGALGLPLELVALANPYAGAEVLPVRLLWQGRPEADTQVSVFREAGAVERTLVRTDGEGRAEIPLAGGGRFVLNAVHVEPAEGKEHAWESTWASLSFGLPAE